LEELVLKCRAEEDQLRAEGKEARRAGWRQWCLAESAGGMRALFRWIREGPSSLQSTGIIVRADGLFAGQKALLAASEDAWWPLWQNPAPPRWERVNPPKATAGWQPQPFNGEELWGLIWAISASKAPGHDGWQARRMRQWPISVWHCIAILFKAIEVAGHWPSALRGGVVCLLPKAGVQATTSTPLEARPVVLLPMLYRLWAWKRGREVASWLKANGMEGLPEESRSAEDYGTLLAAELEKAMVTDEPLLAICVDLSKAYDTVRLDLLDFLLAGSGLPQEVWRPMMDMAKAPRRLKVMTAAGEWRTPSCGLIPGCPAATRIMSLLLERWRRGITTCCPTALVRCWVDDSTAAGRGVSQGLAVWAEATRGFEDLEQGDGSKVNRKKSGILVSHPRLQELVEQATALKVLCPFGLVVGYGPVEPAGWEQHWRCHLGALAAVQFRWRSSGSEAAAAAAVDLRALAAAATVWLAFDCLPPPDEIQEILSGNRGVWLPTVEAEASRLQKACQRLQADGAADRWARGPQLVLLVAAALKDLGVAQGLGKPAKELQAVRAKTAFSRLQLVARLGLPRKTLCRLTGSSALVAGMYGSACHVYDSDFLSSLRNWVMYALYRGSRFAQVRLFMHLMLPSPQADPWQVALRKGWLACELVRKEWGEELFWRVWDHSSRDGPLISFKKLLAQLPQSDLGSALQQPQQHQQLHPPPRPAAGRSLADEFREAGPAWRSRCEAFPLLAKALQVHDLEWVGRHRANLKEAAQVDVGLARRVALKLPAKGMREAFESVLVGDMVVRHQTRHWQPHDGQCLCGLAQETVDHVFWHCPRYAQHRLGSSRCGTAASSQLQGCQRVLGAPTLLPELAAWRASCKESVWAPPPWRADELYADASGRNPKEPQVRVVGWAVCCKHNGLWLVASGWLLPGASVAAGEAVAVARGLVMLNPWGLIVTDCLAVKRMWDRIRRQPHSVVNGVSLPCWLLLASALAKHPTARCVWMRSHRSAEEARAAGYPPAWHEGNARADTAAKAEALAQDVPSQLLGRFRRHVEQAEQVASTVAAIQLARLRARVRTADGGAVKERSRQAPALPRRLRPQGLKRKRPAAAAAGLQPAAVAGAAAAADEAAAVLSCERLFQAKVQELPAREGAMEAVFLSGAPEEGIHDLRPLGPWPLPGTVPPKNGRVPGVWGCSRCGRTAGDTSRAKDLARKPCGGAEWAAAPAAHALVLDGTHWRCSRCLLAVRPQHAAQSERQLCPVAELTRAGAHWPQGEAGLREVFGRLRAFRHFCCPAEVAAEPAEQLAPPAPAPGEPGGPASELERVHVPCAESLQRKRRRAEVSSVESGLAPFALRPYVGHSAVFVGRSLWCLKCFEVPGRHHQIWRQGRCGGCRPAIAMPPSLRDAILRAPLRPELPPAVHERWLELAAVLPFSR
jgi:hypothetical protein